MNERHLQMLMAATGHYHGGIDGQIGPKSRQAMRDIEAAFRDRYTFDPTGSTEARREVAVAQACLDKLGHDPGAIDGWMGNNTTEALNGFLFKQATGKAEVIDRTPLAAPVGGGSIPTQAEVGRVYGSPGDQIKKRLVTIKLPFSLRIDWNLRQKATRITVHRDCADQLMAALVAVHAHYGPDRMRDLGIDRYAGAYNHRKMRGGNSWSMHAYGCAIDFYAEPNGLRTQCPEALFCGAAYKDFLDIMQDHEWLPAIRLWGKDAMHFQRARL
ncbi:M15 family metallopeptidase [Mesobacterium pallidum]|uniref:M15 family metallopeptidase n=1 Tax=Mesobacterium pallidum TaxID=2872037 RepID=UPI001EE2D6BA|nr:M15 family metallopeptidase [Mesobacterium pallidum]